MKRITIQGIVEHEWFKQNLPEHLFPPLGEMATTQIDSSVIAEVCQKLNVSAADVMGALRYVIIVGVVSVSAAAVVRGGVCCECSQCLRYGSGVLI